MNHVIVSLDKVSKSYGPNLVVKNISLAIEQGEFLTLLGSSGCGKTTTLRMIAGFETTTSGRIMIDGEEMGNLPAYKRPVNTAFQSYALFPHLDVYQNIAYGLKLKKLPKQEIRQKVTEMIEMVQLEGFEKRKPSQLSGGQKQRVSIARALINSPKVLLLDEPLGALDLKLRKQMQFELKRLQKQLGTTFIYVTHDQEEALTMSDRIAIMHNGVIEQIGTSDAIYNQPESKYVAEFIGESNIFEGIIKRVSANYHIGTESGMIKSAGRGFSMEELLYVCVRPENMRTSETPVEDFSIQAVIRDIVFVGNLIKIIAVLPNGNEVKISKLSNTSHKYTTGQKVYLWWKPEESVMIKNSGSNLGDTAKIREIAALL
ncbi:MAG: ABC transporter ATP-binding protein [Clostridiaceae bacterium]|nr:ABC transporter ATP-binding protein [Clostridiaceae bacterium]